MQPTATTEHASHTDRLAAQVTARIRHLLDTCPACAERDAARAATPTLSPRRRQILEMASDGLTNRQIAGRLCITEATVNCTLDAARQILGAENTTHAVAIALRAGVIR